MRRGWIGFYKDITPTGLNNFLIFFIIFLTKFSFYPSDYAKDESWVYDSTKAGICALTRNMACEFIQYGIRVNSVAPGWTVTEMHFKNSENPIARKAELENMNYDGAVIRRLARPEEIAPVIAFLLSDDASYITATTIHVDGGRVAH